MTDRRPVNGMVCLVWLGDEALPSPGYWTEADNEWRVAGRAVSPHRVAGWITAAEARAARDLLAAFRSIIAATPGAASRIDAAIDGAEESPSSGGRAPRRGGSNGPAPVGREPSPPPAPPRRNVGRAPLAPDEQVDCLRPIFTPFAKATQGCESSLPHQGSQT